MKDLKEALSISLIPALGLAVLLLLADSGSQMTPLGAAFYPRGMLIPLSRESIFEVLPHEGEVAEEKTAPKVVPGKSYVYHKSLKAKVTGYTPGEESCGPFADGFTSTGVNAWATWGVAADPTHLPYGSLVFIPGIGYREVDDTGSAMRSAWREKKETHIDLRFQEVTTAKEWGVRHLTVHVFLPEEPSP
jgi:3D (Asp-Asp-Asp) domain-containing protein